MKYLDSMLVLLYFVIAVIFFIISWLGQVWLPWLVIGLQILVFIEFTSWVCKLDMDYWETEYVMKCNTFTTVLNCGILLFMPAILCLFRMPIVNI